jgi:hypothetical protein
MQGDVVQAGCCPLDAAAGTHLNTCYKVQFSILIMLDQAEQLCLRQVTALLCCSCCGAADACASALVTPCVVQGINFVDVDIVSACDLTLQFAAANSTFVAWKAPR